MSPLGQFQIHNWIPLKIGQIDLSFSNSAAFMMLGSFLSVFLLWIFLRQPKIVPSKKQAFIEIPLNMIAEIMSQTTGRGSEKYFSFIAALFLFIFMGNFLGMIPYAFTFTSQLIVNFALAFLVITFMTVLGLIKQGLGFLRVFCPKGIPWWVTPVLMPVEMISYLARPCSLAIRLTANIVAGHTMMKIFASFAASAGVLGIVPLFVNVVLTGFELMVAFLQAYVFTMLSCIYLNDALESH